MNIVAVEMVEEKGSGADVGVDGDVQVVDEMSSGAGKLVYLYLSCASSCLAVIKSSLG